MRIIICPREGRGETNMGYKDKVEEEYEDVKVDVKSFWAEHKAACIGTAVVALAIVGLLMYF